METSHNEEIWNTIVDLFTKNQKAKEEKIQETWELIFGEQLGYAKTSGFLDSQMTIPIGSAGALRPDILLSQSRNKRTCAVELKQEHIHLNENIQSQLFSYLKQTKIKVGIIIADAIYLYSYNYETNDNEQKKAIIAFEKNNNDGYDFVDLITRTNFSEEKIEKFIADKLAFKNHVNEIKTWITYENVIKAVSGYLSSYKKFTQSEIKTALNEVAVNIGERPTVKNKNANSHISGKLPIETAQFDLDPKILLAGGKAARNYLNKYLLSNCLIAKEDVFTLASLNKDKKRFWANPPIENVDKNWILAINDNRKRILYLLNITPYSIKKEDLKIRIKDGAAKIDIEIERKDEKLICIRSQINYSKWILRTVSY